MNPYETSPLLDQYLLFHYGSPDEICPPPATPPEALRFPAETVSLASPLTKLGTALDLGCAVGRSSFEFSRTCRSVVGLDYSRAFIDAAESIRTAGSLDYRRLDEGHQSTPLVARLPAGCHPDRVIFQEGDATCLPPELGRFDIVHAANLICRLPDPVALLERLPTLVNAGGHLVLTTPCTWLGEFTPPQRWPDKPTLEWLRDHLEPEFSLIQAFDIPFLIRETSRKFQWTTAQGTLWAKC